MIRHAAAVAVVLCLTPSWLSAQTIELTVTSVSVKVYKAPSTGSPVVGTALRGAVLEVTRELGDWVKVSWPSVPDSTGYVHVSAGSLAPRGLAAPAARRNGGLSPARSTTAATLAPAPLAHTDHAPVPTQHVGSVYITPRTHVLGIGGRLGGSTLGFGASARGWSQKRLGAQVEISRYAITSAGAAGRVTSLEVAPSALYTLKDRVSDYFWLRPFIGAGANWSRSSQTGFGSTSKLGLQAFGGGEATFASVPRFALSADIGYRWTRMPYDGFELGGLRFSVSGHWYVK